MSTFLELAKTGVGIGDRISLPFYDSKYPNYDSRFRHKAQIVGPKSFPNCIEVYLAPPGATAITLAVYNENTDTLDRTMVQDPAGDWSLRPAREGEIVVQLVHSGCTLFEKV